MRISDWSSDVCSSDLTITNRSSFGGAMATARVIQAVVDDVSAYLGTITFINACLGLFVAFWLWMVGMPYPLMWGGVIALLNYIPYFGPIVAALLMALGGLMTRSEEHTSEIQSLMRISYAVFCLKNTKKHTK